jgi:mannosyltransferase OCH1-like enzyme
MQKAIWIIFLLSILALSFAAWNYSTREPFTLENSGAIPDHVWQTYKTKELPPKAKECQKTWQTVFAGSEYSFLDDTDLNAFMEQHFDADVNTVFHAFPLGVMRADLWRYAVMYVHGGMYSDIDSVALKPRSAWNIRSQDKVIIALENDVHFCQWTLASVPQHPLFKFVVRLIVEEAQKGIDTSQEHFVHHHTGPGMWTRAIHQFLGYPKEQKARHTYRLFQTTDRARFEKWGIRLESDTYFSKEMVKNLFGSTQFGDGYISWMEQRKALQNATQRFVVTE